MRRRFLMRMIAAESTDLEELLIEAWRNQSGTIHANDDAQKKYTANTALLVVVDKSVPFPRSSLIWNSIFGSSVWFDISDRHLAMTLQEDNRRPRRFDGAIEDDLGGLVEPPPEVVRGARRRHEWWL